MEASFMKDYGAFGNGTLTKIIISEFIQGSQTNLTEGEEQIVNEIKDRLNLKYFETFLQRMSQDCNNLFTSIHFRGMNLTWNLITESTGNGLDQGTGPSHFSTDFGSCCFFSPHLNMKPINKSLTTEELYHGIKADALNGEKNGLEIVLDSEQFNYAFYGSSAAGFKISLHHHLDKPMIEFSSQLISIGTETQINLKPLLSYTTTEAISTFTPEERGCFADGETNLTYLPYDWGYHYALNNCLIDQGIRDIIWNCRCMPSFAPHIPMYMEFLDNCNGEQLYCAKLRMKTMGWMEGFPPITLANDNYVKYSVMPEALESPEMIGNISKPEGIKCMNSCKVQENNNQMSFAVYPQYTIFFHQKTFCHVAAHIWQNTCQNNNRAYFLNKKQPLLCSILRDYDDFFGYQILKNSNIVSIR